MNTSDHILAWLEQSSGVKVPVRGTCSFGRLSSNTIVLPDDRVSRRHALINVQGHLEFWLVDLGSGNGTYLNGRRVVQPTRLRDGDKIEIAAFSLIFRASPETENSAPVTPREENQHEKTIQQIKSVDCWLLVADIEDSTQLMTRLSAAELPLVTGRWLNECKQLVEACGGSINKFLGDGFFAYWPQNLEAPKQIARVLAAFAKLQETAKPPFRVVLHYGQVFMGGAGTLGEESLQGKEVHFVFRMEKLAGTTEQKCLLSAAAKTALEGLMEMTPAGEHPVPGFDGQYSFYSLTK